MLKRRWGTQQCPEKTFDPSLLVESGTRSGSCWLIQTLTSRPPPLGPILPTLWTPLPIPQGWEPEVNPPPPFPCHWRTLNCALQATATSKSSPRVPWLLPALYQAGVGMGGSVGGWGGRWVAGWVGGADLG